MKMRAHTKGFTLVEIVMVLAILGVAMLSFYTVFFMNWQAFDSTVSQADFNQDLDGIVDRIALDGRHAAQIILTNTATTQQAAFVDINSTMLGTYTLQNNGVLTLTTPNGNQVLSDKLDFNNSNFSQQGKSILVKLTLTNSVFGRPVNLTSSTEIFQRN